ncbi:MAG TPA: TonB-dependent receptor [Thermoanaerobaculia bacterium]|jgi:outer membrane receptor for ferrienterochelin and colicin
MVRVCKLRWLCALAALLVLFGLAGAAHAQTDVTTSRISGTVEDSSKSPLPGVTVEAVNTETGLRLSEVSDAQGFYRILNLPTGTYKVSASLDGFATATAENVRLLIGSTPTVNFTLQSARISETITVTSEAPTVEVTNTQVSTTIQSEQLKNLPTPGTDFRQLVLLTPETRFDSERGNISISGQRGINTNVTVDGVDYNNAFFGGTTGAAEGRAPLSLSEESIKEFSVITNGASAEFGRSGGGFVNVITRSGTNKLHGSGFYYDQPQSLISDFAKPHLAPGQVFTGTTKPADQKKDQFGASLGGSIVRDKLFYFFSYDNQKQDITVPITSSVNNPAFFAQFPAFASPNNYVQTRDGNVSFGRLDYQLNDANRVTVRGNIAKYDGENGTSNAQNQAASHNGIEGMTAKTWVGQYSGQFGANVLNDLNVNYVTEDTPREDKGLGLTEVQLNSPRVTYGEVSFLPITSTNDRKEVGDTLSYLLDKHVIKGGADYNDTGIDQIFKGNWRGVYIFNNQADLLAGKWAEYRQFAGLNGLTADQAGQAKFRQKESALFLQDQWYVRPNLTVTAGVRWENLDNPNAAVLNQNDRNPDGSFKLNSKIPDSNNNLSPRVSISWAPDEKTAVRGSVGRYWSRTPAILFAQLLTANGIRATQYDIFAGANGPTASPAPGWGSAFDPTIVAPLDLSHSGVVKPGVFAIDPNFDNPYTDRVTIGAEREVFARTSLALDLTYAESKQLERLTDINRVYSGATAPNGLPAYSTTTPDPYYARITTLLSDARSKYYGVTATLNRRFADSFSLYAAITYSKDKDNDSNERNFSGIQPEDFNNLDLNYGYSNRDQRWKGIVNGVWQTPWWGLGLSGSFRYITGSPYTGLAGRDLNLDGNSGTDRPTVDGVHFDRNSFRQPDFYELDLRLSKGFKIWEGNLQLFAECYNCSNAANRFVTAANQTYGANPSLGVNPTRNGNFGVEDGVGTPRYFQLGIRFDF